MDYQNTLILTINNKEKTIPIIFKNILKNTSPYTIQIIIVLDGCNDKTEINLKKLIEKVNSRFSIDFIYTADIWETKANNVALKLVKTPFATLVQDDMLIKEKDWDKKMIDKYLISNIFSLSGRAAHDFSIRSGKFIVNNIIGREYPMGYFNFFGKVVGKIFSIFKPYWVYRYIKIFSTRLCAIRGPLLLKMDLVRDLNYFDEEFAPFELDDIDLSCRAFKKFGLYSGCLPIYYEEVAGSKKNNLFSKKVSEKSIFKNTKILKKRHKDLYE